MNVATATSSNQLTVCSALPIQNPQWNATGGLFWVSASDSCSGASYLKATFLAVIAMVALFFY